MILLLVLLLVLVPIAELYVILRVGDAIGAVPTILALVGAALLGTVLLRSQGRAVWRQFNAALAARRMPHRELLDGVAVIFGGALLLTPGFLTDVFGLLLLAPPTRVVIRRFVLRLASKRLTLGIVDFDAPIDATARERRPRGEDPPPQGRIGP